MADKMELKRKMLSGLNCSQCVFGAFADRFDYAEEEFQRIAAGFGGGMFHGDTCGAFSGAVMALGAAFGDDSPRMHEKVAQLRAAFTARFGSEYCRELTGFDFSIPGEHDRAEANGVLREKCPDIVAAAVEIVEALLEP